MFTFSFSYLNRHWHSSLNRMHSSLLVTFTTGLESIRQLPKLGTSYVNLFLEHSRKHTTTSLGGSCRVDSAFIQLLFTDTHQGQNWSSHSWVSGCPSLETWRMKNSPTANGFPSFRTSVLLGSHDHLFYFGFCQLKSDSNQKAIHHAQFSHIYSTS